MAKEYLEKLTVLFEGLSSNKIKNSDFIIKHFFSGAAVYISGKICICLTPVGLAMKLSEVSRQELMKKKGTKPLRYFPQGHIKKEYVVLSKGMIDDKTLLRRLIIESFAYGRSK